MDLVCGIILGILGFIAGRMWFFAEAAKFEEKETICTKLVYICIIVCKFVLCYAVIYIIYSVVLTFELYKNKWITTALIFAVGGFEFGALISSSFYLLIFLIDTFVEAVQKQKNIK